MDDDLYNFDISDGEDRQKKDSKSRERKTQSKKNAKKDTQQRHVRVSGIDRAQKSAPDKKRSLGLSLSLESSIEVSLSDSDDLESPSVSRKGTRSAVKADKIGNNTQKALDKSSGRNQSNDRGGKTALDIASNFLAKYKKSKAQEEPVRAKSVKKAENTQGGKADDSPENSAALARKSKYKIGDHNISSSDESSIDVSLDDSVNDTGLSGSSLPEYSSAKSSEFSIGISRRIHKTREDEAPDFSIPSSSKTRQNLSGAQVQPIDEYSTYTETKPDRSKREYSLNLSPGQAKNESKYSLVADERSTSVDDKDEETVLKVSDWQIPRTSKLGIPENELDGEADASSAALPSSEKVGNFDLDLDLGMESDEDEELEDTDNSDIQSSNSALSEDISSDRAKSPQKASQFEDGRAVVATSPADVPYQEHSLREGEERARTAGEEVGLEEEDENEEIEEIEEEEEEEESFGEEEEELPDYEDVSAAFHPSAKNSLSSSNDSISDGSEKGKLESVAAVEKNAESGLYSDEDYEADEEYKQEEEAASDVNKPKEVTTETGSKTSQAASVSSQREHSDSLDNLSAHSESLSSEPSSEKSTAIEQDESRDEVLDDSHAKARTTSALVDVATIAMRQESMGRVLSFEQMFGDQSNSVYHDPDRGWEVTQGEQKSTEDGIKPSQSSFESNYDNGGASEGSDTNGERAEENSNGNKYAGDTTLPSEKANHTTNRSNMTQQYQAQGEDTRAFEGNRDSYEASEKLHKRMETLLSADGSSYAKKEGKEYEARNVATLGGMESSRSHVDGQRETDNSSAPSAETFSVFDPKKGKHSSEGDGSMDLLATLRERQSKLTFKNRNESQGRILSFEDLMKEQETEIGTVPVTEPEKSEEVQVEAEQKLSGPLVSSARSLIQDAQISVDKCTRTVENSTWTRNHSTLLVQRAQHSSESYESTVEEGAETKIAELSAHENARPIQTAKRIAALDSLLTTQNTLAGATNVFSQSQSATTAKASPGPSSTSDLPSKEQKVSEMRGSSHCSTGLLQQSDTLQSEVTISNTDYQNLPQSNVRRREVAMSNFHNQFLQKNEVNRNEVAMNNLPSSRTVGTQFTGNVAKIQTDIVPREMESAVDGVFMQREWRIPHDAYAKSQKIDLDFPYATNTECYKRVDLGIPCAVNGEKYIQSDGETKIEALRTADVSEGGKALHPPRLGSTKFYCKHTQEPLFHEYPRGAPRFSYDSHVAGCYQTCKGSSKNSMYRGAYRHNSQHVAHRSSCLYNHFGFLPQYVWPKRSSRVQELQERADKVLTCRPFVSADARSTSSSVSSSRECTKDDATYPEIRRNEERTSHKDFQMKEKEKLSGKPTLEILQEESQSECDNRKEDDESAETSSETPHEVSQLEHEETCSATHTTVDTTGARVEDQFVHEAGSNENEEVACNTSSCSCDPGPFRVGATRLVCENTQSGYHGAFCASHASNGKSTTVPLVGSVALTPGSLLPNTCTVEQSNPNVTKRHASPVELDSLLPQSYYTIPAVDESTTPQLNGNDDEVLPREATQVSTDAISSFLSSSILSSYDLFSKHLSLIKYNLHKQMDLMEVQSTFEGDGCDSTEYSFFEDVGNTMPGVKTLHVSPIPWPIDARERRYYEKHTSRRCSTDSARGVSRRKKAAFRVHEHSHKAWERTSASDPSPRAATSCRRPPVRNEGIPCSRQPSPSKKAEGHIRRQNKHRRDRAGRHTQEDECRRLHSQPQRGIESAFDAKVSARHKLKYWQALMLLDPQLTEKQARKLAAARKRMM